MNNMPPIQCAKILMALIASSALILILVYWENRK